jgi:protein-tyrosine phosphatase
MIDQARKEKRNILIHCNLGMNRSTTLLALYIINRFQIYDVDKVLGYMQSRRAICRPSSRVNYLGLKEYAEKVSKEAASSASSGAAALASGAAMTSRERAEAIWALGSKEQPTPES